MGVWLTMVLFYGDEGLVYTSLPFHFPRKG